MPSGARALLAEERILSWWREDLDLAPFICRDWMATGGWTETVGAEAVALDELMQRAAEAAQWAGGDAPKGSELPRWSLQQRRASCAGTARKRLST